MKTVTVQKKQTGELVNAIYGPNSKGNMKFWYNGKFYSDKEFNNTFIIKS